MAHTIPIKYMYGGSIDALYCHPNYPIYSGGSGSLIGVFDACLVNGFGEVSVSSIVINSQGIATVTSTAHGYNKVPLVILISGSPTEAINGEWEITSFTTNTILFNASDSGLTNTTITGDNIKLKVAPLGWEKVFTDVPNYIAVYRSKDPLGRRHFLRVDDADAYGVAAYPTSFFRGYEMMDSAQDTGMVPYPMPSALGRGVGIVKVCYSTTGPYLTANNANISWTLVGTSRQFYFNSAFYAGNNSNCRMNSFFGDITSYVPGDYGASMAIGGTVFTQSSSPAFWDSWIAHTGRYCARSLSRVIPSTSMRNMVLTPTGHTSSSYMGANAGAPILEPDIYTNRLSIIRPLLIADEAYSTNLRGEQPGMAMALNKISTLYNPNTILTAGTERFMYLPFYVHSNNYGYILLSLDSDWNTPFYDKS